MEIAPTTVIHLADEDAYFKELDKELIRAARRRSDESAKTEHAEAHRGHCFRCGTASLVEVDFEKAKVDVCINKNCGAMHLDAGEIDAILADNRAIGRIRKAVLECFR